MAIDLHRRALLGLGLLWVSGMPAFAGVDVAGVWSAIERGGRSGLSGDQMVFAGGGHAIYLADATMLDATYAIEGNTLAVIPDESYGPTQRREFKIEDNKLILIGDGSKPQVMTRAAKKPYPDAHPIVGEWTWPILGNWRAVQRFARSGVTQLVLPPIDIDRGSYRITGDKLELELPRKGTLTLMVRREGNVLITRKADGEETRFAKFVY